MACKTITFDAKNDPASDPERCRCKGAVLRAYGELIKDQPAYRAMDAARRIYRHHHPEDSPENAALTVERWVHEERLH